MLKHNFSQQQRLLQKLALSPQMKHSIQLLSMSVSDLNEYIDSVLASNPFLEKIIEEHLAKKSVRERDSISYGHESDTTREIEKEENPREHVLSQLRTFDLNEKDMEIAEYLVYEMDENGYIKSEPEEVARELFTEPENVEKVLDRIQTLNPPGIGARDIRECLLLQLKRQNKENPLEYTIVSDYLADLAINDIPKIAKSLNIDKSAVIEAVANIKKLNPRPASTLLGRKEERVIPDLVATVKKDNVRIELNRESVPRLRLYNPYSDKLDVVKDPKARKFLKENMDVAKSLIDNIKRREETMCRTADYILNIQKENLDNGEKHHEVNTLTIKNIAEALNLHPSTISRTVSNKYIALNNRTVPLRSLISHGVKKQNGEIQSKVNVKNMIRKLVELEDKKRPLRDNEITERLKMEGISLKRRTIAKYRESLRILPAHLRKKLAP